MKTITIHRLSLKFDTGQVTHGRVRQQASQAVNWINALLRQNPLKARLIATPDEIEIESSDE